VPIEKVVIQEVVKEVEKIVIQKEIEIREVDKIVEV